MMSCNNCNEYTYFRGDDLVDIIQVDRPLNSEGLEITRAELQVGPLMFPKNNPVFPYTITILRNQSINLDNSNPIYLRIYYPSTDRTEEFRTTCLGSLELLTNAQVVKESKHGRI